MMKPFLRVFAIAAMTVVLSSPTMMGAQAQRAAAAPAHPPAANTAALPEGLPAQPITVAQDLVRTVGGTQLPCYPHNVNQFYLVSRGCPVTVGFRRYLVAHRRDVDPICQCQNFALHNTFRLLFQEAGLATVVATLTFGATKLYIVFMEVKTGLGWQATETTRYRPRISLASRAWMGDPGTPLVRLRQTSTA